MLMLSGGMLSMCCEPSASLRRQVVTGDRQAGGRGPSLEAPDEWPQLKEVCEYKVQISEKVLHPLNVCLHTKVKQYISNTVFKAGTKDVPDEGSPTGKWLGRYTALSKHQQSTQCKHCSMHLRGGGVLAKDGLVLGVADRAKA